MQALDNFAPAWVGHSLRIPDKGNRPQRRELGKHDKRTPLAGYPEALVAGVPGDQSYQSHSHAQKIAHQAQGRALRSSSLIFKKVRRRPVGGGRRGRTHSHGHRHRPSLTIATAPRVPYAVVCQHKYYRFRLTSIIAVRHSA